MKYLYGFFALFVFVVLGAFCLLVYGIMVGPSPDIPPDLLAMVGALVLLRIAFVLFLFVLVCCLLYLVIIGITTMTQVYNSASETDKERAKKGLCDSINILKNIVEIFHKKHHKPRRSARPA